MTESGYGKYEALWGSRAAGAHPDAVAPYPVWLSAQQADRLRETLIAERFKGVCLSADADTLIVSASLMVSHISTDGMREEELATETVHAGSLAQLQALLDHLREWKISTQPPV